MAATVTASSALTSTFLASPVGGSKLNKTCLSCSPLVPALPALSSRGKGALGARCDYIGSTTNLIVVGSTTAMLFAGRFGLAPSANRKASAGLKLEDRPSGLQTGDPAGFTGADTLACGALGHIIGVGIVLGLRNIGAI